MDAETVARVRCFNRTVTERVGALDESYLDRGRPLGETRLLWEIGPDGADVRDLRRRLASTRATRAGCCAHWSHSGWSWSSTEARIAACAARV